MLAHRACVFAPVKRAGGSGGAAGGGPRRFILIRRCRLPWAHGMESRLVECKCEQSDLTQVNLDGAASHTRTGIAGQMGGLGGKTRSKIYCTSLHSSKFIPARYGKYPDFCTLMPRGVGLI